MENFDLQRFLRNIPLFSAFTDEDLASLLELSETKSVRAGEVIFRQGDAGDLFYIVYSGRVRILHTTDLRKEVNLGVRRRGDHFGETALIKDTPRNATARAADDTVLVALSGDAFHRFLFSRPELRRYFDKFIRYTAIHQFLKSCTDLASITPEEARELARRFHAEFFKQGDVVFRQGTEADKFYLVESGKLKVVRWEESEREMINFLREGDFFGEKALLEEAPRYADVVCLTDCHLFSLSKEDFEQLVEHSPRIRKVIEDRVRSYLTERPPVPYREIIKQELAAHREIRVQEEVAKGEAEIPLEGRIPRGRRVPHRRRVRFPFIRQHDQMACGTTCLMMISRYYGKRFSSTRLRELARVDLSGASLADLAQAAERLGFAARGLKLQYDSLLQTNLPCIALWQGYHYVVVYRADERHVRVADPAVGLKKLESREFRDNWNGVVLTLEPTPEFAGQEEDPSPLRRFMRSAVPHRGVLLEILLASLLFNVLGLATPLFVQNVVDQVLLGGNASLLNVLLWGMIIVLVFRFITMVVRRYLVIHTSMKMDLRLLVLFYRHLLALPVGYFKVRRLADFIARFGDNLKIRNFLTDTALTIMLDTLLVVVYLLVMVCYNAPLTGIVLLCVPAYALLTLAFTPRIRRLGADALAARAEAEHPLLESVRGIDTVKAMGLEHRTRWKWEERFIRSLNIDYRVQRAHMYFRASGDFVAGLGAVVVLWYGAGEVSRGALSLGQLMAFMALLGGVMTPVNRLVSAWDDVQGTLAAVDRVQDTFSARPEILPASEGDMGGLIPGEPPREIVFDRVFFRYGGGDAPYVLSNINLKLAGGRVTAIVGRSGSGKTTLAGLLARLYDVTEGRITADGQDIRNMDLAAWRGLVGFVMQDTFIFDGTIRENISLGDPEERMEKVSAAARLAEAEDFISGMPLGYETRIGESGLQLSPGQRQRIGIARVLYRNAPIMIFDEATSNLDSESERAIRKNLEGVLKDKTVIIIAHRLRSVRHADRILVLDNGEIVEEGDHETLMGRKGLYHYLSHQQWDL